jgi:hypothetical protein
MKNTWLACAVLVAALFACKDKPTQQAAAEPAPAPPPAPTQEEPKETIADFRGSYTTTWGSARCTQVKRNVNCLYGGGKSGGLQCKVVGEDELDCEWDEPGLSGKAKLTKKDDGRLVGSWGHGSSSKNGGPWIFKPKAE